MQNFGGKTSWNAEKLIGEYYNGPQGIGYGDWGWMKLVRNIANNGVCYWQGYLKFCVHRVRLVVIGGIFPCCVVADVVSCLHTLEDRIILFVLIVRVHELMTFVDTNVIFVRRNDSRKSNSINVSVKSPFICINILFGDAFSFSHSNK
jgi:hypothetical protein